MTNTYITNSSRLSQNNGHKAVSLPIGPGISEHTLIKELKSFGQVRPLLSHLTYTQDLTRSLSGAIAAWDRGPHIKIPAKETAQVGTLLRGHLLEREIEELGQGISMTHRK